MERGGSIENGFDNVVTDARFRHYIKVMDGAEALVLPWSPRSSRHRKFIHHRNDALQHRTAHAQAAILNLLPAK